MEKGSFHTSVKSVIEMDDFIESVPLPNQVPSSPDLSRLPPETLQSSAIETLLGQNTDLMARLGVSLRKSSAMEHKQAEMEKENLHLRHRLETLRDQLLVTQEKDRLNSDRSAQTGLETGHLRDRLAALERKYTEVYTLKQNLERQLDRLLNYRHRVRRCVVELRERASQLAGKLHHTDPNMARNLAKTMDAATFELTGIRAEHSESQLQIVHRYESDLANLRSELELRRRQAADRDLLYESKVRLENQLVFEERQARQYREDSQSEIQSTKQENHSLREQLKIRLIEMDRLTRELEIADGKVKANETSAREQLDQVESLQLLWKEKQAEVERLSEKNRALQKLNQQLSVNLNSQRKEISDLRSELESSNMSATDKIRALERQLK